jgi:hypothetical protein
MSATPTFQSSSVLRVAVFNRNNSNFYCHQHSSCMESPASFPFDEKTWSGHGTHPTVTACPAGTLESDRFFIGSVQCLVPYFLPASLLFLFAKRTVTVLPLTCSDHCSSFMHSIFFFKRRKKKGAVVRRSGLNLLDQSGTASSVHTTGDATVPRQCDVFEVCLGWPLKLASTVRVQVLMMLL